MPIQCVGVWDTVGALGIPDNRYLPKARFCGSEYRFLDVELGAHVVYAFQALAEIDERRPPFAPVLWTRKPGVADQTLKQVWFRGVHSDASAAAILSTAPPTSPSCGWPRWSIRCSGSITTASGANWNAASPGGRRAAQLLHAVMAPGRRPPAAGGRRGAGRDRPCQRAAAPRPANLRAGPHRGADCIRGGVPVGRTASREASRPTCRRPRYAIGWPIFSAAAETGRGGWASAMGGAAHEFAGEERNFCARARFARGGSVTRPGAILTHTRPAAG